MLGGGPAYAADRHRGLHRHASCSASPATSRGPGVYEVPFGATLRELLDLAGGVAGGRPLQTVLLGGAAGGFVGPDELDLPLTFEGARAAATTLGSGVVMVVRRHRRPAAHAAADRRVLPRRVVRAVRALPRRHRAPGGGAARASPAATRRGDESELALLDEIGPVRCATPRSAASARPRRAPIESALRKLDVFETEILVDADPTRTGAPPPKRMVELADRRRARRRCPRVRRSSTVLTQLGVDDPTLCYGETLTPVNACRVCVVEIEGARVLAPSCSRKVEAGMEVQHRLRARPPLAASWCWSSSARRSTCRRRPHAALAYCEEYEARARALRPAAPPPDAGERDRKRTGHHVEPDGLTAATVHQPIKVDNELYVRDYSKCILCYKCVDACGDGRQNTFAIAVAGRGFDARISTEYAVAAARLRVRLLRQLHRRLPDRRADVQDASTTCARPARGTRSRRP